MVPVLRAKSGAERLRIAWDLYESALEMMAHHLAAEHPDWSEDRLHREVTRRLAHETG